MADDDDKPPHLKVVSGNPNARAERKTAHAKGEAQRTLTQFAAALLRAIAGNETEATYLFHRLSELIKAHNELRTASGKGLTVEEQRGSIAVG